MKCSSLDEIISVSSTIVMLTSLHVYCVLCKPRVGYICNDGYKTFKVLMINKVNIKKADNKINCILFCLTTVPSKLYHTEKSKNGGKTV